jgi:formate dehydrogenase maturation protein FdhE
MAIDKSKNFHINELTKCPICDESDINVQTNCAHLYCLACITEWYNKSSKCPTCRQQITHVYHVINKQ